MEFITKSLQKFMDYLKLQNTSENNFSDKILFFVWCNIQLTFHCGANVSPDGDAATSVILS